MTPPIAPAISAPDLVGPVSILNWPISGPRENRRRQARPYGHVRVEIDLKDQAADHATPSIVRRIEQALREREVTEAPQLVRLAEVVLHAFASQGFQRVQHWETHPGGWLPLPSRKASPGAGTLGELVRELEGPALVSLSRARSFAVRLEASGGIRADVEIRARHRERRHAISIDLNGRFRALTVHAVVGALASRLPVERSMVTRVMYA